MTPTTAFSPIATSPPAARPRTPAPSISTGSRVQLPVVLDLAQAAALLGIGRTSAYRLVQDQQWPTPVLRLG